MVGKILMAESCIGRLPGSLYQTAPKQQWRKSDKVLTLQFCTYDSILRRVTENKLAVCRVASLRWEDFDFPVLAIQRGTSV